MTSPHLLAIVDRFPQRRIAVVGDLMLDVYFWGRVTRISPEAPVPIVQVERTNSCLGGAANAMRNLATLGSRVHAFGVTGCDPDADNLLAQLDGYGIDRQGVFGDPKRRTTNKQRVISGTQQLLRIDHEDVFDAPAELRRQIVDRVLALIDRKEIDAVIFEDYAKGMLDWAMVDEIVRAANRAGVITALDPKPGHMAPIRNLTVIKPNQKEAFAMARLPEPAGAPTPEALDNVAARLREIWAPEYLLISLAAAGMALYDAKGNKAVIPTFAREVYDVSGAGDTVVATFTLALAAGAEPVDAAKLGNYAAGIVVGKIGTVTVTADELRAQL